MNKAISIQQLAVAPARRKAEMLGPPRQASPPAESTPKAGHDRVSISATARAQYSASVSVSVSVQSTHSSGTAPAPFQAQAQQVMDGLRGSFFSKAGDDNFNTRYDFNADGVINAGDLAMFRQKLAGGTPMPDTEVAPPQTDPAPPPPTLSELRDAFFSRTGDENFNAAADLNQDGMINAGDLAMLRQSMTPPVTPDVEANVTAPSATAQPVGPGAAQLSVENGSGSPVQDDTAHLAQPVPHITEGVHHEPSSVNILAQLRSAFFSSAGDDRFNAALDVNGDGRINVADFAAARIATDSLGEDDA